MAKTPLLGTLAAVVLVFSIAGGTALAQINPFGARSDFKLSRSDLDLVGAAAAKLYLGEKAELGAQEKWSNPETGNKGRVVLTNIFTHEWQGNDLPCRRLIHDIKLAKVEHLYRFIFDRCKLPGGEWKLL